MTNESNGVSRRGLLKGAAVAAAATTIPACSSTGSKGGKVSTDFKASGKNINHSVVHWCFNLGDEHKLNKKHGPMTEKELMGHAKKMGVKSVEIIGPEHFKDLANNGLVCAIAPNGMPGAPFVKGCNNTKYHKEILTRTKEVIDACSEYKFPNVIAFNGYKYNDAEDPNSGEISLEEGAKNCVTALKELTRYAEKKNVTVCIEQLNTRDGTHPMKGHPGYQGDDMDYVAGIVKQVGSPNCKLLFDIYHVQIMNGDVIRRIHEYKDLIGHIHIAGNPGRSELDYNQEINYPAVMSALAEVGYKGYSAQEFIPTWDDKIDALRHAVALCDV